MNNTSQRMLARCDKTSWCKSRSHRKTRPRITSTCWFSIAKDIKLSQLPSQKPQKEQVLALNKLSSIPHSTLQTSVPAGFLRAVSFQVRYIFISFPFTFLLRSWFSSEKRIIL